MLLSYILVAVAFIVIAMLWTEGTWSNALTFFNILFSGIISWTLFEPIATYMEGQMGGFTYLMDFMCFWGVFALAFNVMRAATDQISIHKVRFRKPVEQTGRVVFAVLSAWLMICLICASLHLAPLGKAPFRGSFADEPLSKCFFGFPADRYWLAFLHSRSNSVLATSPPRTFDPNGEFTIKYRTRRARLEAYNTEKDGAILVDRNAR